jgi:hypothetical protein
MPPCGAGLSNVTVPVNVLPPVTAVGNIVRLFNVIGGGADGVRVRFSVSETPPKAAVIATTGFGWFGGGLPTPEVPKVKLYVDVPAGTETGAGRLAKPNGSIVIVIAAAVGATPLS